MVQVPKLKRVTDVVAEDSWSFRTKEGAPRISRIIIGRPRPWPGDNHNDWVCPLHIDDFTDGTRAIAGVGPVDALMNAMGMVKAFAEEIKPFTPRADAHFGNESAPRGSEPADREASTRARQKKKTRR